MKSDFASVHPLDIPQNSIDNQGDKKEVQDFVIALLTTSTHIYQRQIADKAEADDNASTKYIFKQ